MGIIYSASDPQQCLARYENGNVYMGESDMVCGYYRSGKVYDINNRVVATYNNSALQPSFKFDESFEVLGNCIYRDNTVYVQYRGFLDGACAAAYLYYRNRTNTTQFWSFQDLWKNIFTNASTFVKILFVAAIIWAGYSIFQLPAIISTLLDADFGWILLCIWGGAFLFGFKQDTCPKLGSKRHVITWLWELLIPYLHATWITLVANCIYAMIGGNFSFSYLSGILYYLPQVLPLLATPLYIIHLVRLLYLLYRDHV